jgi:hypothetical protein
MLNKLIIVSSCVMLFITATALVHAANGPSVPAPIQSVMTPYLQIHDALAKDSLDGVSSAAAAISKAAQADKMFPGELSQEAQALAQAKDLASAREAFKPLSETLIKVLGDNKVSPDAYAEAYCPMEKARWLQTGTTVSNPFGSSMATCGSIVSGKIAPATTTCPMGGGCCN